MNNEQKPEQKADCEKLIIALGQRLNTQNELLQNIATSLAIIAHTMQQQMSANLAAPNIRKSLKAYAAFNWAAIGADVIDGDNTGPTLVEWNGKQFTRRAGTGKFGESIWFSRSIGKDEAGENQYERLITFKDYSEAEPVPGKLKEKVAAV